MQKLLTFAVPTYNMEAYLSRCLESVLCDNKDYLEVLVVNDGSKDRSSEIAHQYEAKYPHIIRAIDKENGNYGTCVNRALAEAKGKYFRMLDADDWCDTNALNELLKNMEEIDSDLIITESVDRNIEKKTNNLMSFPNTITSGREYSISDFDAIKLGFHNFFCSHMLTYKTSILRNIGLQLQAGISYTDNEYVFFPIDHIQSVICYRLPLYQYFIGREGQTTQPEIMYKMAHQIMLVFDRLFAYYKEHKNEQIESVTNNQRILLAEMLIWVYRPLFTKSATNEMKLKVKRYDAYLIDEPEIKKLVRSHKLIMYGIDLWKAWDNEGLFTSDWKLQIRLQSNRLVRLFKRKLHILD